MPEVHIHLTDPSPDVAAAAIQAAGRIDAAPPATWQLRVRETNEGVTLEIKPEVRDLLVQFGWMPPVDDGEQ